MKSVKNVNRIKIANKKVSRSQVKARVGTVHYSMKIRVGNVWYICFLTYPILDHSDWASFSNFNAIPAKTTRRLLFSVLPDEICLTSSSSLHRSIICMD